MPARLPPAFALALAIALCGALPALAATASWEAYDLKTCRHWSLSPTEIDGSGPRYEQAVEMARRANGDGTHGRWLVIEGSVLWEDGEPWYGVCRFDAGDSSYACLPGIEFPLSGASYRQVLHGNADATYACTSGCGQAAVTLIVELAYEEATRYSRDAARLMRRFESRCHDKARRDRYIRLSRQRARAGQ